MHGVHSRRNLSHIDQQLDLYLPQVVGAYNSTRHATTGRSPFLMLTGKERKMPLVYFHPEYEDRYTVPRGYVTRLIEKQKAVNQLVRSHTAQVTPSTRGERRIGDLLRRRGVPSPARGGQ